MPARVCVGYESTYIIVSGAEWNLKVHFTILSLSVAFKEKKKKKKRKRKKEKKKKGKKERRKSFPVCREVVFFAIFM